MQWWSVLFIVCLAAFYPLGSFGATNNPRHDGPQPAHPVLGPLAMVGCAFCIIIGIVAFFQLLGGNS